MPRSKPTTNQWLTENQDGWIALWYAANGSNSNIFRQFCVLHSPDDEQVGRQRNHDGDTLWMTAIRGRFPIQDIDIIDVSDFSEKDNEDCTALHHVIINVW